MKNLLSKIKAHLEGNYTIAVFAMTPIVILILCFALFQVPSAAADEPIEGGQSASPTDLTGTIWDVPSGWTSSIGYGSFDIYGKVTIDNSTFYFTRVLIGSSLSGGQSNSISFVQLDTNVFWRPSSFPFSISFISGPAVTDPLLISWLMANGTWTNPPEPEPTPTYTIPAGTYLINETTDMPPLLSPYTYTSRFSYDGKVYTNLVFNRQGIFFIDEAGEHLGIYQRANVNNPWSGDRNFTLLTEIVTEDEELYNYFINNTQPYEPDVFDVIVYFISGFFKALDKFVIFYNFSLLDFIFVMCGLLSAIWFLKVLAGG